MASTCNDCSLFSIEQEDGPEGRTGRCYVQPQRGVFPGGAPVCSVFKIKHGLATESTRPKTLNAKPKAALIIRRASTGSEAVSLTAGPSAPFARTAELVHDEELGLSMTRDELVSIILNATGLSDTPLAPKWDGGTVRLLPGNTELQSKDIPIDQFFHKVVMVRDRLRVLEQKINAHPKLSDAEKVDMQQYITRCYGSLTTFNVLFGDKADHFSGQKGEDG